jgi:hypothetical protein
MRRGAGRHPVAAGHQQAAVEDEVLCGHSPS